MSDLRPGWFEVNGTHPEIDPNCDDDKGILAFFQTCDGCFEKDIETVMHNDTVYVEVNGEGYVKSYCSVCARERNLDAN
jgi:hypothetical protein